ncbi:hypothetical protein BC835DRAFT_1361378 [Cytidiella melzeri]|nr:hypothetical protein BC835DRAFT_1361378 [Cytidiella melzeri]
MAPLPCSVLLPISPLANSLILFLSIAFLSCSTPERRATIHICVLPVIFTPHPGGREHCTPPAEKRRASLPHTRNRNL